MRGSVSGCQQKTLSAMAKGSHQGASTTSESATCVATSGKIEKNDLMDES